MARGTSSRSEHCRRSGDRLAPERCTDHLRSPGLRCAVAATSSVKRGRPRDPEREALAARGLKRCPRCRDALPLHSFSSKAKSWDGRTSYCRICDGPKGVLRLTHWRGCARCRQVFRVKLGGKCTGSRFCSHACATQAGAFSGERNGNWAGEAIGYSGAHRRVMAHRGVAREHACIDCGQRAEHWSLNLDGPRERLLIDQSMGCYYSLDPDQYDPRCALHHRRYDSAHASRRAELAP